jgi:3-oxoacyl-[acyl-carrier-protein] synthase II
LSVLPPHGFPIAFAAEAREFQGNAEEFGTMEREQVKAIRKGLKVMCRECQMGVAAAQLALGDAGLGAGKTDPERTGIAFGSDYMISLPEEFTEGILQCLDSEGRFQFSRWATDGMPKMSPLWLLKYLPNMPASHLAIYNDLRGPNNSLTLREAAAGAAIGEAYQILMRDRADVMVVGATGTRINPTKILHAVQQEELATSDGDPARASRPFDRNRSGMVLGEGAGAVVLETLASAQARGATIYAEVMGGTTSSAVSANLVARRDQALRNVLAAILSATGNHPNEVGFVHAHGLSTRTCDIEEARAINEIFGERRQPVPVTAAKSYFGNLGAGSGMVEMIAGVLALVHDCLFPVLNYETPDPECPLHIVVDGGLRPGSNFVAMSVTPQGQASAAMFRRFEG